MDEYQKARLASQYDGMRAMSKEEMDAIAERNAPLLQNGANLHQSPYADCVNAWGYRADEVPQEKPVLSRWGRFMAWLRK